MTQAAILEELKHYISVHLSYAETLKTISKDELNKVPSNGGWNALQCLEHLNRYGVFYLKECGNKIEKAKKQGQMKSFKAGFWGKLFTKDMLPKEGMKTMKTFKSKNPSQAEVDLNVIQQFIEQQKKWLSLLEKAKHVDLNKNFCNLTIPIVKMNLGSTLRFTIYHNERHIVQAKACLMEIKQ